MKNVDRLTRCPKQREYNLLEHCYMVAQLFQHFAPLVDVPYDITVLRLVLNHDILEAVTGDLPYDVKNLSADTSMCWEKIENEATSIHPILEKYSDSEIKEVMSPGQHHLFKLCDLLELWIFLKEEHALGNNTRQCLQIIGTCERLIYGHYPVMDRFMDTYKF